MLETWGRDNADLSSGIILFGSYLADGFFGNGDTNVFPVPVLTAMGALDGGALSYVTREAREAQNPLLEGKYPVFVIDRVNHGQVHTSTFFSIIFKFLKCVIKKNIFNTLTGCIRNYSTDSY